MAAAEPGSSAEHPGRVLTPTCVRVAGRAPPFYAGKTRPLRVRELEACRSSAQNRAAPDIYWLRQHLDRCSTLALSPGQRQLLLPLFSKRE